jgi:hypothetical protein
VFPTQKFFGGGHNYPIRARQRPPWWSAGFGATLAKGDRRLTPKLRNQGSATIDFFAAILSSQQVICLD